MATMADLIRHEPFLLTVARRYLGRAVGSVVGAEDFVQDTFAAAAAALARGKGPRIDTERGRAAWLRTVLRRQIADHFRGKNQDDPGPGADVIDSILGQIPVSEPGVITEIDRRYRRIKMREALERLSEADLRVLRWVFFEGLNGRQMAERLGCSDTYARRLRRLALQRLKRAYDDVGGAPPTGFSTPPS